MQIDSKQIEAIGKEVADYELHHYGQRFGADFPAIAEALAATLLFTQHELVMLLVGPLVGGELVSTIHAETCSDMGALLKDPAARKSGLGKAGTIMRGSYIEMEFMQLFYWGYRVGRRVAEVENLERMHQKP